MRRGNWIELKTEEAVLVLLRVAPPLSERQIAAAAGCARGTVRRIRLRGEVRERELAVMPRRTPVRQPDGPRLVPEYVCPGCRAAGATWCRTTLFPCPACEARQAQRGYCA